MRCKHCGSKMIFPDTKDKRFSTGKAVAGAVAFGLVGAAAGFIGKEIKGYRCSCCGMFSEDAMAIPEETLVNLAVNEAKISGKSVSYERFREKYLGIEQVPTVGYGSVADSTSQHSSQNQEVSAVANDAAEERFAEEKIKNRYSMQQYIKGCPVLIEEAIIKEDASKNLLILSIRNVSGKALRSLYLQANVYDDVGDVISEQKLVYQGVSVENGSYFPTDKEFDLQTEVAYKVAVSCEKAAFTDDSVWRRADDATEYILPEKNEITELNFPQFKYLRRLVTEKSHLREDDPLYQPVYTENCGVCICGAPICSAEPCPVCGLTPEGIADILDYDTLIESRKDLIKHRAKERHEVVAGLFEQARQGKYDEAINLQEQAKQSSFKFKTAAQIFASLSGYKDSDKRHQECLTGIENCKKDAIYSTAVTLMSKRVQRIEDFKAAIKEFQKIPNWKDANDKITDCENRITEIREKEEAEQQRREEEELRRQQQEVKDKKKRAIFAIVFIAIVVAIIVTAVWWHNNVTLPNQYADAKDLLATGKYSEAIVAFEELEDYQDSEQQKQIAQEKLTEEKYQYVLSHMNREDEQTYEYLAELKQADYKDSDKLYQNLYNWDLKIVVNNSETNTTTDITEFERGTDVYFHVLLSGGPPGASTTVTVVADSSEIKKEIYEPRIQSNEPWWVAFTTYSYEEWIEVQATVDNTTVSRRITRK